MVARADRGSQYARNVIRISSHTGVGAAKTLSVQSAPYKKTRNNRLQHRVLRAATINAPHFSQNGETFSNRSIMFPTLGLRIPVGEAFFKESGDPLFCLF